MVELRSPGGIDDTSHGDGTFKEGDKESKRLNGIACVGGLVRRRIGRRLFRRAIFRLRALWRRRSNHPVLSESQCFVCTVRSNLFRTTDQIMTVNFGAGRRDAWRCSSATKEDRRCQAHFNLHGTDRLYATGGP